jgi:hypothetical protein
MPSRRDVPRRDSLRRRQQRERARDPSTAFVLRVREAQTPLRMTESEVLAAKYSSIC